MKPNILKRFKCESYEIGGSRCWGCCQENCSSCNCGCHTSTETMYRVVRDDGVVVADNLHYKVKDLKAYLKDKFDIVSVKKAFAEERNNIKEQLRQVDKREKDKIKWIKDTRGY